MEKSMSEAVEPVQKPYGAEMTAVAAGLSLFWAPLFSMLVRNEFPCAGTSGIAPALQEGLLLRVAFFLGFAACALVVSRLPEGRLGARGTVAAAALVTLFSLDTAVVGAASLAGILRPLAVNLLAWALLGAGLASLLFLWVPFLARLRGRALASCLALSTCAGAAMHLAFDLLSAEGGILFLALAPLASLCVRMRLAADLDILEPEAGESKGIERILPWRFEPPTPLAKSRKNALLSWAFGIVNAIYGVVFGLEAGTVTQWGGQAWVPFGIAAAIVAGAVCAHLFMARSRGRVRQSTVMRLLFPVLVVALVPQALFSGTVLLICSLLVIGCYVFLILVSIGFEIRGALERGAAPLFFVGMSQTAFAVGLAGGFALGMLPGLTGTFDHTMLSGIALVLVVALAIIVATAQDPMANAQDAADAAIEDAQEAAERAEFGRWKTSCALVAERAGLSNRETEVFMLLAKGRGTEHIQNKLGISGHTVKTHTYNIYHKMGIGSREELLDAVENALEDDAR